MTLVSLITDSFCFRPRICVGLAAAGNRCPDMRQAALIGGVILIKVTHQDASATHNGEMHYYLVDVTRVLHVHDIRKQANVKSSLSRPQGQRWSRNAFNSREVSSVSFSYV